MTPSPTTATASSRTSRCPAAYASRSTSRNTRSERASPPSRACARRPRAAPRSPRRRRRRRRRPRSAESMGRRVLVVGAGIFGVTAAIELRRRANEVTLVDPGPVPHPLAASTDISKIVRLDYGADEAYTAWMERALERWRAWNADLGKTLFHETDRKSVV